MGVSKNRGGPPKWMVKIMENPIKMDDFGVALFLETPTYGVLGSQEVCFSTTTGGRPNTFRASLLGKIHRSPDQVKRLEHKASLERLQQWRARLRKLFAGLGERKCVQGISFITMNKTKMMQLAPAPVKPSRKSTITGLAFGNDRRTRLHSPCRIRCSNIRWKQSHNSGGNLSPLL